MTVAEETKTTVRAVLAEAKRLRERGESMKRSDPFAKPYMPSDATARGLSQRMGPDNAIAELQRRARMVDDAHREQEERSTRARARLDRQQRLSDAQRRQRLSRMTLGQRLDEALSGLVVVSEQRAAQMDPSPVSHSREESHDPLRGRDYRTSREVDRLERDLLAAAFALPDFAGWLRDQALVLIAEMEDELPRTRQRIERRAA